MRGDKDEPWSVEYFDSNGCPPIKRLTFLIEDWTNKLKKYRKSIGDTGYVTSEMVSNKLRHQLTSSECGLHSLIFIRRRLEGVGFKYFSKYKIPDMYAKEFRKNIFIR